MRRIVLIVALLAFPGCGVPLQSAPDPIDSGIGPEVQFTAPETNGRAEGVIYLVEDEHLVVVFRGAATSPSDVLAQLLAGPTSGEERSGLRTAIPPGTVVREVTVVDSLATVEVSASFAGVGGREEILAIAQVVLTLAAAGVEEVTILLEGLPVAVPLPDGVLVTEPVGFSDYQVLIEQ